MSACITTDGNGYLVVDQNATVCDYVALTPTEYTDLQAQSIQGFSTLLETLFVFDPAIFQDYLVWCLVMFIGSYSTGVIVRLFQQN